jgi:hypothetical protein
MSVRHEPSIHEAAVPNSGKVHNSGLRRWLAGAETQNLAKQLVCRDAVAATASRTKRANSMSFNADGRLQNVRSKR